MTDDRGSLLGILRGLMVCEHLGDVHNEILLLCDVIGIPQLEGDFHDGWTDKDWKSVSGRNTVEP